MKRLKAFFGGLATPSTSEFWLGWGSVLMKIVCLVNADLCAKIDGVSVALGFPSGAAAVATVASIAAGRMVSKAAKA